MAIPEWITELPVEEGVYGQLGHCVGERDHHEGEEEQDQCVEDRVHHEGQQKHKAHTQDHRTELDISPVDDVKYYRWSGTEEGQVRWWSNGAWGGWR